MAPIFPVPLGPICDNLRELHRQRQDLHRAEKSLTNQIKAQYRRACENDKTEAEKLYRAMFGKGEHALSVRLLAVAQPFIQARGILAADRKEIEKRMAAEAEGLPVAAWVEKTRGFGLGSLAAIVGEAGALWPPAYDGDGRPISGYANPGKLWKRMGLAVHEGERQCKKSDPEEARIHGYSPPRRSVMWNVGEAVWKAQSARIDKKTGEVLREAGEYRLLYDARKAFEATKPACMKRRREGICQSADGTTCSKGHLHNRAKRYMEKRILLDLWRAWQSTSERVTPIVDVSAAAPATTASEPEPV